MFCAATPLWVWVGFMIAFYVACRQEAKGASARAERAREAAVAAQKWQDGRDRGWGGWSDRDSDA
jgi:hypothetical protein